LTRNRHRDEAILWALAFGFTQGAIAKAWHISAPRLTQILRGRGNVPGIAPRPVKKWRAPWRSF
jgi:hypothetical protein